MEALMLTFPSIILLALPVLLFAFIAMESADLISQLVEKMKKSRVKVKTEEEKGLFIR
jgi:hypothetical protein